MFLISLNQNPKSATLVGLGISNGIIGLAGALLVQYKGVCDINMSFGLLVTSLASLMLGEQIRTRRIEFYFFCCVGGSIVYNFIIALVFFGLDTINGNIILSSDVKIITGILFIGLSLLSRFRKTPSFQLFNSNW